MINYKFNSGLLLLAIFLPFSALAQREQSNTQPLLLDPAVRTGKLPNGFTYYIRHNEEPKNRVVMNLVNKVGSILEDEDQRGLAHFMEHMSFNGTTHFPHNELVNYLQKAGVRFGADLNAHTSFDETVYELPIPSDKPGLLDSGLQIMRDWAHNATLDPAEIDRERGVVLEEKRLGKNSLQRFQEQSYPLLFNHSRYAERLPIGIDTVLDNFKPATIRRFYNDWYRPDLQALIIVGDINADSLEKVVKAKFSDMKNPDHERTRINYTIPINGNNHFMAIKDNEATSTNMEIVIKYPHIQVRSASDYHESVLRRLMLEMLSERYRDISMDPNATFLSGQAGTSRSAIPGLFVYQVYLEVKPGALEPGFKSVWRETERMRRFGFTQTEFLRAKQAYSNALESNFKDRNKIASVDYAKLYSNYFLLGEAAPGEEQDYRLNKKFLAGISVDDVNKLAKSYRFETNRDIIITAPEKERLPSETEVNNWFNAIQHENIKPYVDDVAGKPLFSINPIRGKITTAQKLADLNVVIWTLSNGVKVLLKPTDFQNDQIKFTAFSQGGTSCYNDNDFMSAVNAVGFVTYSGVNGFNNIQLDKLLSGKNASVSPYMSENYEGVVGLTTPNDLETALQMTNLYFNKPWLNPAAANQMIDNTKVLIATQRNSPNQIFNDTIRTVLGNYNYRVTPLTIQKLNQINLQRSLQIYKECFADAGAFTFVFVGNIDTVKIKPLIEKYLGSLPVTHENKQMKDLMINPPNGIINKIVHAGVEPKAIVKLVYSGNFKYNQANQLGMDALKETLEIRLLQRLREDESGVYAPGVSVTTVKYPESRYTFSIDFSCAPQNVNKLVTSTLDEVSKLKLNGPLPENLDKWKAETKNSIEPQLKTNDFWLNYLSDQLQNNESLTDVNHENDLLEALTPMKLKDLAGKYLSGENFIKFCLMPEK